MSFRQAITLRVNGKDYERVVETRMTLADFLRGELDLTGTHLGCEHGGCGACTVLMSGEAVRSCLLLAVQADGAEIMTVEGLGSGSNLHPLQEAFQDQHALQCGFCTPGFLMTAYAFLQETPRPSEAEAREEHGEDNVAVGRFPWVANARAVMSGETTGWVKSIHETTYGELVGVVIVGPHATDLIEAAVVALDAEATVETVSDGMAPHPTLSEGLKEAGLVALERAIHLPPRRKAAV